MFKKRFKKNYVSAIDKMLNDFNQNSQKSASQKAEIRKYQHISLLRDQAMSQDAQSGMWEDF